MVDPVYTVDIEWESGSFTSLGGDVQQFSIQSEAGGLFTRLKAGSAKLIVDNRGMKYSPSNTVSTLDGFLIPGKTVRIQATHSSSTYNLFVGTIDSFKVDPSIKGRQIVSIACRDQIKKLVDRTVTTSMFVNTQIQSLFSSVLSEAEVSSVVFGSTFSEDIVPFVWFDKQNARNSIQNLIDAGFHRAFVDGAGAFTVQSRYWDQEGSVVSSFDSFFKLNYQLDDRDIMNAITVRGTPRLRSAGVGTLAWIDNPVFIPASGAVGFSVDYLDPDNQERAPADLMVTPVNSSDYQSFVNSDGTGTEHTATTSASVTFFGQSAVCSIHNGTGADVWLTKFQLRGQSIQRKPEVSYEATDPASSEVVFGRRGFNLTSQFVSDQSFVEDYANFLRDRQKNPQPAVSAHFRNQFPDQLGFDLGAKIHVTNAHLGIIDEFNVNRIKHTVRIDRTGTVHETEIEVDTLRNQDVLILDSALFGKLDDDRKLGF